MPFSYENLTWFSSQLIIFHVCSPEGLFSGGGGRGLRGKSRILWTAYISTLYISTLCTVYRLNFYTVITPYITLYLNISYVYHTAYHIAFVYHICISHCISHCICCKQWSNMLPKLVVLIVYSYEKINIFSIISFLSSTFLDQHTTETMQTPLIFNVMFVPYYCMGSFNFLFSRKWIFTHF